jgi:hypothetical protein
MTTNCGQLPMPNSVIGAATVTTASDGVTREAPGAIGGKPSRTVNGQVVVPAGGQLKVRTPRVD